MPHEAMNERVKSDSCFIAGKYLPKTIYIISVILFQFYSPENNSHQNNIVMHLAI